MLKKIILLSIFVLSPILTLTIFSDNLIKQVNASPNCSDIGITVNYPTSLKYNEPLNITASGGNRLNPGSAAAIELGGHRLASYRDTKPVDQSGVVSFSITSRLFIARQDRLDDGTRSIALDLQGWDDQGEGRCFVGSYTIEAADVVANQPCSFTEGGLWGYCGCKCPLGYIHDQSPEKAAECSDPISDPTDRKNQCENERTCTCVENPIYVPPANICAGTTGQANADCVNCVGSANSGIWTAFGCIETEPGAFAGRIFIIAVGMAGGLALLLMLFGAFSVVTASGNPEGVQKGKERITSAIIGLMFIVMAVTLLNIIGVKIFQIPGL